MNTYQIEIIDPKAKKLLDDLTNMNLITVQPQDMDRSSGEESEVQNGNGDGKQVSAGQREAIMSLAGSWNGMSENDFQEYLSEAKRSGGEMCDRDVGLPCEEMAAC